MPQRDTPRRYSKRQQQRQRQDFPIEIRPEAFGLIFLALALLTGLSLLSASRGSLTESWLRLLEGIMGWGMYLAPFVLAGMGIWLLRRFAVEDAQEKWEKPIGLFLLFLLLLAAFQLISPGAGLDKLDQPGGGGLVGWAMGETLVSALGLAGSVVVLAVFGILGLILVSNLSLVELVEMGRNAHDQINDWRRRRALATAPHRARETLLGRREGRAAAG